MINIILTIDQWKYTDFHRDKISINSIIHNDHYSCLSIVGQARGKESYRPFTGRNCSTQTPSPPPNILYASVAQNNMCYDTGSFCVLLKCIGEDHSHLAGKEEGWGEYICSENFHQLSNKYDMNFFLKKKTFLGISLHLPLIAYYH